MRLSITQSQNHENYPLNNSFPKIILQSPFSTCYIPVLLNDVNNIIKYATEFKMYHITYFNSLKAYIQSLDTREEIGKVNYGVDIPEEYQSNVLKSILLNRNNAQIESDNNENNA